MTPKNQPGLDRSLKPEAICRPGQKPYPSQTYAGGNLPRSPWLSLSRGMGLCLFLDSAPFSRRGSSAPTPLISMVRQQIPAGVDETKHRMHGDVSHRGFDLCGLSEHPIHQAGVIPRADACQLLAPAVGTTSPDALILRAAGVAFGVDHQTSAAVTAMIDIGAAVRCRSQQSHAAWSSLARMAADLFLTHGAAVLRPLVLDRSSLCATATPPNCPLPFCAGVCAFWPCADCSRRAEYRAFLVTAGQAGRCTARFWWLAS